MFKKTVQISLVALLLWNCEGANSKNENKNQEDSTKVIQTQKKLTDSKDAPSLVDILNTSDNFSLFTPYLTTNISTMLAQETPYTVLVPTKSAMEQLGEAKLQKLLSEGPEFVKGHIIKGKFDVAALQKTPEITTLQGKKFKVSVQGDNISIGDAKVVAGDIIAKNGVIHALDKVLE